MSDFLHQETITITFEHLTKPGGAERFVYHHRTPLLEMPGQTQDYIRHFASYGEVLGVIRTAAEETVIIAPKQVLLELRSTA